MRILQNTKAVKVEVLGFTPGNRLVAGGSEGFDVWDIASGEKRFLHSAKTRSFFDFAFDPAGAWLYCSSIRLGCLRISLSGGNNSLLPGHPGDQHVVALAVSPDGGQIAVSRGIVGSHRIECWQIVTDEDWNMKWSAREGGMTFYTPMAIGNLRGWFSRALAFAPGGDSLCVLEGRDDAWTLTIRDGRTGERTGEAELDEGRQSFPLRYTKDGTRIVCMLDRRLDFWDVESLSLAGSVKAPGSANLRAMALHPNGLLGTAGGEGVVRMWDTQTFKQRESYKWGIGKLHSIAFSPDGMLGAAGGDKGKVVVWDIDA